MSWNLLFRPEIIWVVIPVVGIVVWGVVEVVRQIQVHRERQAMIDQGMHPDFPPDSFLPEDPHSRRSA